MQNPPMTQAPKVEPNRTRNLTHEGIVNHLKHQREAALAATPPYETVEVNLPKLDAKGAPVKDGNFTVTERRAILKRELVAAEWDEKIKNYLPRSA